MMQGDMSGFSVGKLVAELRKEKVYVAGACCQQDFKVTIFYCFYKVFLRNHDLIIAFYPVEYD